MREEQMCLHQMPSKRKVEPPCCWRQISWLCPASTHARQGPGKRTGMRRLKVLGEQHQNRKQRSMPARRL